MKAVVNCHVYKLKSNAYIKSTILLYMYKYYTCFKEPHLSVSLELKYNIMVLVVRRLISRVKMKDERKSNEMKKKKRCVCMGS